MKIFMGIVMTIVAIVGLLCTTCGVMFLQGVGPTALIGIIPGLLLLWWATAIWKAYFATNKRIASAEDTKQNSDLPK